MRPTIIACYRGVKVENRASLGVCLSILNEFHCFQAEKPMNNLKSTSTKVNTFCTDCENRKSNSLGSNLSLMNWLDLSWIYYSLAHNSD